MADALCGPSNALKSFSGHVEQDRSLQQDHAGPASQPQFDQFRTADPNTPQAHDTHFHDIFNHGPAPIGDLHHGHEMLHHHTPSPMAAQHHAMSQQSHFQNAAPAMPDWASQFQQMNINQQTSAAAVSIPQQSVQPQQTQHVPQFTAMPEPQAWHSPLQQSPFGMPMNHGQAHFPMPTQTSQDAEFTTSMDQWMAQHGPRAEAAIDAEMESLARELEAQEATQELLKTELEFLAVQKPDQVSREPESEVVAEEERKAAENPDELAVAARRIVDVMDTTSTSDKMKKSGFLSLMRKLADGDVTIRDQGFVDENGTKINMSGSKGVENGEDKLGAPKEVNITIHKGAHVTVNFE
ncbi:hypothetical protein MKZ38_005624 [Zalerion maritima]|uniref:Uncharacterized protein n=1 Tax=Zalerion maritima TaxID=339359 RepID=A0AAD5RJY3_9PEZI|nr:hypothetical protein MKZ38_005624 [Zalerion maritima]